MFLPDQILEVGKRYVAIYHPDGHVGWQRRQADRVLLGDFDFGRDLDALFAAPSDDRFIIKVNYWLGM